jgi:hypothetical protein
MTIVPSARATRAAVRVACGLVPGAQGREAQVLEVLERQDSGVEWRPVPRPVAVAAAVARLLRQLW